MDMRVNELLFAEKGNRLGEIRLKFVNLIRGKWTFIRGEFISKVGEMDLTHAECLFFVLSILLLCWTLFSKLYNVAIKQNYPHSVVALKRRHFVLKLLIDLAGILSRLGSLS